MVKQHIKRDFSDHRKNKHRPIDEFYRVEIISFDHDLTREYYTTDGSITSTNTKKKAWKGWTTFMSDNKDKSFTISCEYFAEVKGEYRIDVVYETFSNFDFAGTFMGQNMIYEGATNHLKRKTIFKEFDVGNVVIDAELPNNVYFYGLIVRKTREYVGDSLDSFGTNMMLEKVNTSSSSQINPIEMSFEIAYDTRFEYLGSPTGLYMDYNDEVNVYLTGEEDKEEKQIFGGYLSSILPDDDRTVLNISCADRMVDGQNRYILTRMRLLGGSTLPTEDAYSTPMDINFDTYGGALKYLCECIEISLNNNIGKNDLVTGETAKKGFNINFGKNKKGSNKKIEKVTTKNSTAVASKNFITLRNKPEASSKQEIILYVAKDHTSSPHEITDYNNFTIVYGLGNPETSHDEKTTEKVANVGAGSQKFSKCGVSADGKYLMAIGLPSAGKDSVSGWTKTVFERKCPMPNCGSTNLIWDWNWGSYSDCLGHGGEGGSAEGHIFCKGCDADFSVQGWEHINGSSKHMKKVSSTVKSSREEAQKLKNGKMSAVPKTGASVSADDIFKAISDYAFKHFKYKLTGDTYQTASDLEKHGKGDCWAFSDWIFKKLKEYKVNCKVVQYHTNESDAHRSVLYQAKSGKYVDFPYREYGWGTKYNNMLNNTAKSKSPDRTVSKYTAGGSIEQATSKSGTSTQTSTVHVTEGYSRDKPLQGYFAVEFSTKDFNDTSKPSFKDKTSTVYVGFTQKAASRNAFSGFTPIWINNSTKQITVDLLGFIRGSSVDSITNKKRYFLHSIRFIAPVNKVIDTDRSNHEGKIVYKVEDWYTYDKSTHDNSSCKMDLYSINFNNSTLINPTDLDSCGKNIVSLMTDILTASKYTASKIFAKHRCDDIINFAVDNQTEPKFVAHEGDRNNILDITGISFTPRNKLFNNSSVVFKDETDKYRYVESRYPSSVLNYQEQTSLITSNEKIGSKEAYYLALNNSNYNPIETFDFTIVLPYFVNLQVGDLVQVIANSKKLNTIKTVSSVKYDCDYTQIPKIQTEISLGELPVDLQVQEELREIRKMAKKETTSFSGTAMPIEDTEVYEWDN